MKRFIRYSMKQRQRGLASVEFAIAGLATIIIIFAAIELARLMFTVNALTEASRRGARVASVCLVSDTAEISRLTIFNDSGTGTQSPILRNLTTDNVRIEYLNQDGAVLNDISGNNYLNIWYVRVRIANYQHNFIFPGLDLTLTLPEYPTTVPRESLGVPRPGQTSTCV